MLTVLEARDVPATFTVINTNDAGAGSFRQALLDANSFAGQDEIHFSIPGNGVQIITMLSSLPMLTGDVVIDGYTQEGSRPNTQVTGSDAVIQVEINGSGWGGLVGQPGSTFTGVTIRGLSLVNFAGFAVYFDDSTTTSNLVVTGNFIGLRADGETALGNSGGLFVDSGTGTNNRIGGLSPSDRNIVSANGQSGIDVRSSGTTVQGNYVGTTADGNTKRPNGLHGIVAGGSNIFIGGNLVGAGNLISGNTGDGIHVHPGNSNITIQGNRIGTTADGLAGLGNTLAGIYLDRTGGGIQIGGSEVSARNIISGNGAAGVTDGGANAPVIQGNYIGTDSTGEVAVPNGNYGILIGSGQVGGTGTGQGNLISGNVTAGVHIDHDGVLVAGNRIGVSASGKPLGNLGPGVSLLSSNSLIGRDGDRPGGENIIAHNQGDGVHVAWPASGNRILGNSIFANNELGIELFNGGNRSQQAPSLSSVTRDVGNVVVAGTLTSPAGAYRIEVFANPVGEEEGQVYLGSGNLTVGTDGVATFSIAVASPPDGLNSFTATATRVSTGDTSPFSGSRSLTDLPPANTPPVIGSVPNQTLPANSRSGPITFSVSDAETAADQLTVLASTSNPGLVPVSGIVIGGSGGSRTVTISPILDQIGTATITLMVADSSGLTSGTTFQVDVTAATEHPDEPCDNRRAKLGWPQFAVAGSGTVSFRDPGGAEKFSRRPFSEWTGGIRPAVGDVTGDGIPDLIVGRGAGGTSTVVIYNGSDGTEVTRFDAFESTFTGGVFLATTDFNMDGIDDLIISPDEGGGPRVRVLNGADRSTLADFLGIEDRDFRGGARVATGDVTGDCVPDLVVAAGVGGGPRVAVFNGADIQAGRKLTKPFGDFFVFEATLRNGVYVASGDIDGDGHAEVIAGGGPGGGPRVFALSGRGLMEGNKSDQRLNFFAGDPNSRDGVRVVVKDLDGDSLADVVSGAGSRANGYRGDRAPTDGLPAVAFGFDFSAAEGVYVG